MNHQIKKFLNEKYVNVPDLWIAACLNHLESQDHIKYRQNLNWVKNEVYDQWLHSDLTTLKSSCLQSGIENIQMLKIFGNFPLQINEICDIGYPLYSQLQKLRKDDTENARVSADQNLMAAWEPKPSRMLKMQLTDGTTVVQGIEYSNIPCLSISIQPGTKILVKGQIETRRGILLLTKDNVSILGGCVDSLMVSNAAQNIIHRKLNMEPIDNPTVICSNSNLFTQETSVSSVMDESRFTSQPRPSASQPRPSASRNNHVNSKPKLGGVNSAALSMETNSFSSSSTLNGNTNTRTISNPHSFPEFEDDDDDNDLLLAVNIIDPNYSQSSDVKMNKNQFINSNQISNYDNKILQNKSEEDLSPTDDFLYEDLMDDSAKTFDDLNIELPFNYLCHLNLRDSQKKFYTIKGFIMTLKSRLKVIENKWNLTAVLNDGTGSCDVDFESEVLEKLMRVTLSEFQEKRREANLNPELKASVTQMVSRAQKELISLCCLLKIETGTHLVRPKVLKVFPVTEGHYEQFVNRP